MRADPATRNGRSFITAGLSPTGADGLIQRVPANEMGSGAIK